MTMTPDLKRLLAQLGFHYLSENLADWCAQTTKKKLSSYELVEHLARLENEERLRRGLLKRVTRAGLGRFRPLSDYDWLWPKKIPREQIEDLMTLKFLDEPANAILFGPAGVGKTMIAKNIAHQAATSGHTALFVEASDMLADLERQESSRLLKMRMTRYVKPKLLVVDEVGYLSYSSKAGDLLFQVLNKRHEKTSTIVTTNVSFKDWGAVFPGAACMVSLIDRLTHRAEIISIEGDSFRRKEAQERKQRKPKKVEAGHATTN